MALSALSYRLWRFHGGLRLDAHKAGSAREPTVSGPLPERLILPLQQHVGEPARRIVEIGAKVLKGELLARADGYVSAAIHAPTSGTVVAVGERPVPHPSGLSAPCITLEPDGRDQWGEPLPPLPDYPNLDPMRVRKRVREAGIVGLGGAAFPTAVKLNPGPGVRIETLILNGVECEPYITCDEMLMREQPERIVGGLLILRHALQAEKAVIAIEDNKPEAIEAMIRAASSVPEIRVQPIPTIYPAGGEKQLIYVLTGREVPSHGLPAEIGVVCQNVATAAAVYAAVVEGRPLISRYVTLSGFFKPRVLEALIGTPVRDLIEHGGGYPDGVERLIMGGSMMGFALSSDEVPVVKGTNCILAMGDIPTHPALPCIRCGACTDVCPANLLPQQLYWYARSKEFDKAQDYHLFDCIECGCCAAVCPSNIPLVQYYRFAKTEIWTQERERQKADLARRRYEDRLERLEREKQERAEKLSKRKAALDKPTSGDESKKSAIEAAVARAKAKKIEKGASPSDG